VKLVIAGSLSFTWCIAIMPHCNSFGTLLTVGALSGVFGAVALPASAAISVVEGRKYGMVTIMTLFEMATSLGLFFGPPVGGLVGDKYGLSWAFYFAGALSFIGTIVFYILVRHSDADNPLAAGK
jgi:MFS family permease